MYTNTQNDEMDVNDFGDQEIKVFVWGLLRELARSTSPMKKREEFPR